MTSCSQYTFLLITFDWIELETWDKRQSVPLTYAQQMICDMTYLGHLVTFRDLGLRSSFEVDLLRSKYTWFDSSQRDKHDATPIMTVPFKKLFAKNYFAQNSFFTLVTCRC